MSDKTESNLDDMIQDALSREDQEIFNKPQELGFFALALSQFSGKLSWVTWVIMITQSVLFIAGLWFGFQFIGAQDALSAIKWGIPFAILILMATQFKLSLSSQMHADRVIREVKRLELLIVSRDK